jgi:parallel beta-helix repeat protein
MRSTRTVTSGGSTASRAHRPHVGRWSTAITCAAIAVAGTSVAAHAATVSCVQPVPGPPPQLRVTGYRPAIVHDTSYSIPAHALFVANNGSDQSPGTISAPLASIRRAIAIAAAGETIVVRGGVYREALGSLPRRLTIQAYPHETPWVRGSVTLNGPFVPVGGVWEVLWTSPFCDTCYPSAALDPLYPAAGMPEQVFVDGAPLAQVTARSAMQPHTFFVDHGTGQLLLADDPTGHILEVTERAGALSIGAAASGSVVRGIGFEHWGTTYQGAAAVVVSTNATFDNDTFAWSSARALRIAGANDVVTNSSIIDNGMTGVDTYRATSVDFERNEVAYSNFEHWSIAPSTFAALAGVKAIATSGSVFRHNNFHDNDSNALWFDQQSSTQVVIRNTISHNSGHGVAIEISGDSIVAGNVIAENGRDGIKLAGASYADVYNNSVVDNGWAQIGVYEDARHANGGIALANDIFMAGARSIKYVLNSYDVEQPGPLTTLQMIVRDDHNLYGRTHPSLPSNMVLAQTSANVCTTYSDLASFRAATNREVGSTSADGWQLTRIFVDPAHGMYKIVQGAPLATPTMLPARVAVALGTGTTVAHVGA